MPEQRNFKELADLINSTSAEILNVEELEEIIAPASGCGCGGLC